jgi:hypothetical protein
MSPDDHGPGDENTGRERRLGPADVLGHAQLLRQGTQAAHALTSLGVRDGDPVAVLLPMSLESVVVTLACIRIGAMRITLPVGDHLGFVRNRIRTSGARIVITANSCRSDGSVLDVKAGLDRALWGCPEVRSVLVVPQLGRPIPWVPGRDMWWHEALAAEAGPPHPGTGAPYAGGMSGTTRPDGPPRDPDPVTPEPTSQQPPADPGSPRPLTGLHFDDPLDRGASDDADLGWGERPFDDPELGGTGTADLVRFLRERPPHHL